MDKQIRNTSGNLAQALDDRLTDDLSKAQHRFGVQDPFTDAKYLLKTANEMIAKADELGFTRFQGYTADREVSQISKENGVWTRDDGKTLDQIQAGIDQDSLKEILSRAELRKQAGQDVGESTDKKLALADATTFLRIQDPALQEQAAVVMSSQTQEYPNYKMGLEVAYSGYVRNPPKISPIAEKVAALAEAADTNKQVAIDPAALERVANNRARDTAQAKEALGLNVVEPNIEKERQQLAGAEEEKRQAWLQKASNNQQSQPKPTEGGNKVESDEIFTATQDIKPLIPPEIEKQYLRVGDKFYHPKNTGYVAFEDKGNKLETTSNSEGIAENMVRIAEARGWDEIKVSGSETFRREVWLEAAARGMHIKGYSPSEQDKAELMKRTGDLNKNKIEPENKPVRARENEQESHNKKMADAFANKTPIDAVKQYPELAGAAAAAAAIDKKAQADGLSPAQREIVASRVRQNVVNSIEKGNVPEVKIKQDREVNRSKSKQEDREHSR